MASGSIIGSISATETSKIESNGVRVLGYSDERASFKHFYLHPKDTFGALIQIFKECAETLALAGER